MKTLVRIAGAALAGFAVARFVHGTLCAARARRLQREMRQEVHRWEDEGGALLRPRPVMVRERGLIL